MVLIHVSRYVHEKHACMISLNEVALLNASDVWTFSDALPLTMMSADAKNAAFFLHTVRKGNLSELRELLSTLDDSERRQRLRAEDEHGNTALLIAMFYEYPNVAWLLLQYEATDLMHTNARGHTALSVASRSKRPFVVSAVLQRLLSVEHLERGTLVTFSMLTQLLGSSVPAAGSGDLAVILGAARHNLIDFYTQLNLEALSLCVVRAFKHLPGSCLYECVELAAAIQLRSGTIKGHDAFRSDELEASSARLQLAAAGCLASLGRRKDGLGRYEVDCLLQSPLGESAVKLAIRHSCKHFLSQPPVQALLTSEWQGPLLHARFAEGGDTSLTRQAGRCVVWLLVLIVNLMLLPFITAFPPLENVLIGRLKRDAAEKLVASQLPERKSRRGSGGAAAELNDASRANHADGAANGGAANGAAANGAGAASPPTCSRRRRNSWPSTWSSEAPWEPPVSHEADPFTLRPPLLHYYLLRVPLLKFILRLLSDAALAICATFAEGEPSVWVFLVWPLGGLVSEYTQLIAADETTPTLVASLKNEVLSWVRSDTPSTYRADLFNTVDMVSLHLLLASEIAYYTERSAYLPLRAFAVLALYVGYCG